MEHFDAILPILRAIIIVGVGFILAMLMAIFDRRARKISSYRKLRTSISQLFADYIKLIFKERIIVANAKPFSFALIPIINLVLSLLPLAAVPLFFDVVVGGRSYSAEIFSSQYGLIYCILCLTLFSYFNSLTGFVFRSSHGALRSYRMLSHIFLDDILIILSLLGIALVFKTLDLHKIIQEQGSSIFQVFPGWGLFVQPVGALIFLLAIISKCERAPFNYSSGVNDMGARIDVDFSGSGFLLMMLARKFFVISCVLIFVALFMGGYNLLPGLEYIANLSPKFIYFFQAFSFVVKAIVVLMVVASITGPRLQYDKSVLTNWTILFPVAVGNLVLTVLITHYFGNSWM